MTTADIIMIFLGIMTLMVSFGGLIVAILTFLDQHQRKSKKK